MTKNKLLNRIIADLKECNANITKCNNKGVVFKKDNLKATVLPLPNGCVAFYLAEDKPSAIAPVHILTPKLLDKVSNFYGFLLSAAVA